MKYYIVDAFTDQPFGGNPAWEEYLEGHGLKPYMDQAVHIAWGTGGGLMPED